MVDTRKPLDTLTRAIEDALESGVTKTEIHSMVSTANPPAPTNGLNPHNVQKDDQELPIYDVLPPGLIDLPTARKKYGCTRSRFANWVANGRLKVLGRLRAPARGGGYLVVSEEDLAHRLATVSTKGGRPRKT